MPSTLGHTHNCLEQCRQGKSAKWIRNFVKRNMLGVFGMGVLVPNPLAVDELHELIPRK